MVQRGISSFYSSIRGAQLCVRGDIFSIGLLKQSDPRRFFFSQALSSFLREIVSTIHLQRQWPPVSKDRAVVLANLRVMQRHGSAAYRPLPRTCDKDIIAWCRDVAAGCAVYLFQDVLRSSITQMMRHKQFRRETKREDGSLHVYECDESSVVFSISVCTLAAAGFAFQVRKSVSPTPVSDSNHFQIYNFFGLPIIFAILLFPLTCVEYLLTWYVAVEDYASVVGSVTVAA